jgi:hypothetical protein
MHHITFTRANKIRGEIRVSVLVLQDEKTDNRKGRFAHIALHHAKQPSKETNTSHLGRRRELSPKLT